VHFVEEAAAPETPTQVPGSRNRLILVLALAGLVIVSAALLSIGTRAGDEPD
jgi:hypothetical protein